MQAPDLGGIMVRISYRRRRKKFCRVQMPKLSLPVDSPSLPGQLSQAAHAFTYFIH